MVMTTVMFPNGNTSETIENVTGAGCSGGVDVARATSARMPPVLTNATWAPPTAGSLEASSIASAII